ALSSHELYERKVNMQELHAAIDSLPNKQAKRIYAHFILGMTKQDIDPADGDHEKVDRVAIERGLRH
ncbi:sigma-70 family RNA polymerase sigma factor, partial [Blautia wexlerae]|nr:sigma-70 family RNA polymerase sigma factor [Blautia wexlerae]